MRTLASIASLVIAALLPDSLAEEARGAFVASDNWSLAAASAGANGAFGCDASRLLNLCLHSGSYTSDSNPDFVEATGMGMSGVGSNAGSGSSLFLYSVGDGAVPSVALIIWRALFVESASALWLPSQIFHPPRGTVAC